MIEKCSQFGLSLCQPNFAVYFIGLYIQVLDIYRPVDVGSLIIISKKVSH